MRIARHLVRQALLAALTILPAPAFADPQARYENGAVVVTGLDAPTRADLLENPDELVLQVTSLASRNGMPVSVSASGTALLVKTRFALRPGTDYTLRLGDGHALPISLTALQAPTPKLTGFEPSQAVVPANMLRIYLRFSEAMARGQLRGALRLYREDGSEVPSPFLTLGPELWDPSQTRVTLLLDPGRIKQGVGPNIHAGAPLEDGQGYRLVIEGRVKSAAGAPLGSDATVAFRVGPAERRAIAPESWQILAPPPGSRTPLTVAFRRIMDANSARRHIALFGPDGARIGGAVETDGGGWSLTPDTDWRPGRYRLVVDPELEDVSGNTPGVPFDATAGTIGTVQTPVALQVEIAG